MLVVLRVKDIPHGSPRGIIFWDQARLFSRSQIQIDYTDFTECQICVTFQLFEICDLNHRFKLITLISSIVKNCVTFQLF